MAQFEPPPDDPRDFSPEDAGPLRSFDAATPLAHEAASEPETAAPSTDAQPGGPPAAPRFPLDSLEAPYQNYQPAPIHWAVGWADLMMTMFILFLVLYLFQSAQHTPLSVVGQTITQGQTPEQKVRHQTGQMEPANQPAETAHPGPTTGDGPPDPRSIDRGKFYDLSKLAVEDKELAQFAEIDLSPDRTVRIILAADLLFPSGAAELSPAAKANIKKIATVLKVTPYMINVVGHTDNLPLKGGAFATNWELSVMRATTVARFLIDETGIQPGQFTVSGHSFYEPKADNDTPASRAKNRRVEIIVSRDPMPVLPMAANQALIR